MFHKITRYFEKRAEKRGSDDRAKGFGWAMSEYHLNSKPLDYIEAFIPYGSSLVDFDRGAVDAISIIKQVALMEGKLKDCEIVMNLKKSDLKKLYIDKGDVVVPIPGAPKQPRKRIISV